MTESTPFQMSRIYGLGWSVARQRLAAGDDLDEIRAAGLNPYPAGPEQTRWADGFKAGLRGWRGRSRSAGRFGQHT